MEPDLRSTLNGGHGYKRWCQRGQIDPYDNRETAERNSTSFFIVKFGIAFNCQRALALDDKLHCSYRGRFRICGQFSTVQHRRKV